MARKHEAAEWLKKVFSPSKIAAQMGVSIATVMPYLYDQVGEGKIRRSDIVFSIDRDTRTAIESLISQLGTTEWSEICREASKSRSIDSDDLRIYLELRDARIALGDMYEFIREIELTLHALIRETLLSNYGDEWWRKGIPERIRIECATALEDDEEPAREPFCYTNFIHLAEVLEKQWKLFEDVIPAKLYSNRRALIANLARLNKIRNFVMHPVKGISPTEEDFMLVREFRTSLQKQREGNRESNH